MGSSKNNKIHLSKTRHKQPKNIKLLSILQPILSIKHKRCPKGTRYDKKQQICLKHTVIKHFDNLDDIRIADDKTTVTLELIDKDKKEFVIKTYENGLLQSQDFFDKNRIQQQEQLSNKYLNNLYSVFEKLEKDPEMLNKNIKFNRFKKKMAKFTPLKNSTKSGGGQKESEKESEKKPFEVQIQNGVIDILSQDETTYKLLESRTKSLQKQALESNIESTDKEINEFYSVGTLRFKILRFIETIFKSGLYTVIWCMFSSFLSGIVVAFFLFDISGLLCLLITDIISFFFPNKELFNSIVLVEYIYYTIYIIFGSVVGSSILSPTILPTLGATINYYVTLVLAGGVFYEGTEGLAYTNLKSRLTEHQYTELLEKKGFFEEKLEKINNSSV